MENSTMSIVGQRSPRLTIGLPVFNGERYLPQTLSCLLAQTFDDFELIVCDNASGDRTREICLDFASRDWRLRYVHNERNLGSIPNFNRAAELGSAPFFKWTAHDDLYSPSYLAECMAILERSPDVVLAHSDTAFIGEDGEEFAWDSAAGSYVDPLTSVHQWPDSPDIGKSTSPTERFWEVLSGALWGTHIFGVIRRPMLQKTRLLENFVSSDRAFLAELALLGRFETCEERLFKKRFHRQVSWALNQHELRDYLSTVDKAYSRRARQVRAFFAAPSDKPISGVERMVCTGMVALHCLKVFGQALTLKDRRNAARAVAWRQNKPDSP
jgi:glycosyltransferase involved in cell wall biosynthesis